MKDALSKMKDSKNMTFFIIGGSGHDQYQSKS